ncbi:hypothetical protein ACNI3Q_07795 [Sphingomonas sp. FW199]|uniref:hypothetical protein n=1 Tax=Sphingomonas sp. FW199 TaxID=3400217 RepID=UPI003CED8D60
MTTRVIREAGGAAGASQDATHEPMSTADHAAKSLAAKRDMAGLLPEVKDDAPDFLDIPGKAA